MKHYTALSIKFIKIDEQDVITSSLVSSVDVVEFDAKSFIIGG